ncbi:MAG: hypothetical protein H0T65_22505 [Deltaproteobacteria bacterium]|nr:hypothetical protein [Deltaproteobacteria bacterium]
MSRSDSTVLASASDDPASPLRVVVSMRSDFLDRAAEDRRFLDELTRGLVFLQAPDRAGLQEALIQPVEMLGYKFEDGIVHAMLETLESTPGPLPLLQFTAAKLWAYRDKQRRVLTREAYLGMGGVAGALATHADEVLATFTAADQKTVRAIFQRLVTPERTRAVVETGELRDLAHDVERVISRLVEARLLVVQTRGDSEGAVELVHESLIKSWPMLQRWLDENQEHAAYLSQLAVAAKQWDAKHRPPGLLWTSEAMEEARLFRARFRGQLPAREHAFLEAVYELSSRAARRKRRITLGIMATLVFLTSATFAAAVYIRQQQQIATNALEIQMRQFTELEREKREKEQAFLDKNAALEKELQTAQEREQALAAAKSAGEERDDAVAEATVAVGKADRAKRKAEEARVAKLDAEKRAKEAKAKADALEAVRQAKLKEKQQQIAPTLR